MGGRGVFAGERLEGRWTGMRERNSRRSKSFVRELGKEFRVYYPPPEFKVFIIANPRGRSAWGLNELLYDICVARVSYVRSAGNRGDLPLVKDPIWEVESEFALGGTRHRR